MKAHRPAYSVQIKSSVNEIKKCAFGMLNNDSANNIQSIHVALSKKLKQNNRTPVSRCRNIILHEPTHACDSSERDAGVSIW